MRTTLFPPLDDSDEDDNNIHNEDNNSIHAADRSQAGDQSGREKGNPSRSNILPSQLSVNFEKLKSRTMSPSASHQLAVETAILVNNEVSRWKNSIAELEALLDGNTGEAGDRGIHVENLDFFDDGVLLSDTNEIDENMVDGEGSAPKEVSADGDSDRADKIPPWPSILTGETAGQREMAES